MVRHYKNLRQKRHLRVRGKVKGAEHNPRLSVFRSNKHISAQLIDDEKGITLAAMSDLGPSLSRDKDKNNKTEKAYEVGLRLAKEALDKGIKQVVFDRGGYRYHGRVKALAEGARKGGLKF